MQRIIIDTNVIVSALISRSYPFLIIERLLSDRHLHLCISDEVFREYYEVMHRDKFSKFPEFLTNAQLLLADIEVLAIKFLPKIKLDIIDDADDNKFLELAIESDADFLITGNTNDFTMREYERTKIVTPKEYWENYVGV